MFSGDYYRMIHSDVDELKKFLSAFEEYGIPMKDKNLVYVARTGNMKTGTIAERKRDVILKYLDLLEVLLEQQFYLYNHDYNVDNLLD